MTEEQLLRPAAPRHMHLPRLQPGIRRACGCDTDPLVFGPSTWCGQPQNHSSQGAR